ncbi:myelin-associated glycoprotein-like [Brachionichthys hirsutus]|uniref:myelin-associated glycoprotein-like n=1 Tax=Brachionichthys hirsutus TaxID=412623 RepID=UPI003604A7AD
MTGTVKAVFMCCLLRGTLCQNWNVSMPRTVRGLSGTCVQIPCTFTLPSDWDGFLSASCKAIWKQGTEPKKQVFGSSLSVEAARAYILQGTLTGDLGEKDCTTVFNDLPWNRWGDYHFRLECNNWLKYSFPSLVSISVQDSLPEPTITPPWVMVEEGSRVRLKCSALATCPILPPALTWTPGIGDVEEVKEANFMTSAMNFVASHRHNGQTLWCRVVYKRQSGYSDVLTQKSVTLQVTFLADPSGPVPDGATVTLTCLTVAVPPVDRFTWVKVTGGQRNIVGSEQTLILTVTKLLEDRYHCEARNVHGAASSEPASLDVTFAPEILPSSNCTEVSSQEFRCSCRSRGNPLPSLIWELAGGPINNSADVPVKEIPLGNSEKRSVISLSRADEGVSSVVCRSINSQGSVSFAFNGSFGEAQRGPGSTSLLIGCSVGVMGMLLVCIPLMLCRKRGGTLSQSAAHDNCSRLDVIYANKVTLEQGGDDEEDSLHYVEVDFVKLRANSEGERGEEEVRGSDSQTEEYARIYPRCRGED